MRKVTLDDFIMPEFHGQNPDDYEFRGKTVSTESIQY